MQRQQQRVLNFNTCWHLVQQLQRHLYAGGYSLCRIGLSIFTLLARNLLILPSIFHGQEHTCCCSIFLGGPVGQLAPASCRILTYIDTSSTVAPNSLSVDNHVAWLGLQSVSMLLHNIPTASNDRC